MFYLILVSSCVYFFRAGGKISNHTVDGRNPAPVDMVNIPLFTWFYTSQVVQDFFHQQYCIHKVQQQVELFFKWKPLVASKIAIPYSEVKKNRAPPVGAIQLHR